MGPPLVTVICLCYNHKRFLREAIESVMHQTYHPLQVIVADDASTDDSVVDIHRLKEEYSDIELLLLTKNVGNCKAFNAALKLAKGDFVIDFATDDIMLPDRIEKQVHFFNTLDPGVGVIFTDARLVDETGKFLRNHFEYLFNKGLLTHVPQGDVYRDVVSTYFIPSPTMMARREVFETLGGYDEELAYEDFDFWVRSARHYRYAFLNERLTSIRKSKNSMSAGWYVPGDAQLYSTYLVCKKAQHLNRDAGDHAALVKRVRYEFRQSVLSENHSEADHFYTLLKDLKGVQAADSILLFARKLHLPLSFARKLYHTVRFP